MRFRLVNAIGYEVRLSSDGEPQYGASVQGESRPFYITFGQSLRDLDLGITRPKEIGLLPIRGDARSRMAPPIERRQDLSGESGRASVTDVSPQTVPSRRLGASY